MGPLLKFHLFDLVSVNGRWGGGGEGRYETFLHIGDEF